MNCRHCGAPLQYEFIDLGNQPLSNSFLRIEQLQEPEVYYPLKLYVCHKCWLVQIDEYKKARDIFNNEYMYFSSYSQSWLAHSKHYVEMMIERFSLNAESFVLEIASNDGYLLQYFVERGIPAIGIEPAANTAAVAQANGIHTIVSFWSNDFAQQFVRERQKADVILGNNVLAHVPNINDFVSGLKTALAPNGVITMEFPHLMRLVAENQFDTIYHEHFSYLSFTTVFHIFNSCGLRIFDVEELPTHGGSLRVFATHSENNFRTNSVRAQELLQREESAGMTTIDYYTHFQEQASTVKNDLLLFLIEQKRLGSNVIGYGAAAKGNTLLNYAGIKVDLLRCVVDASPHKQGKYLPGSHIPVLSPEAIRQQRPDYVLILPWNIQSEVRSAHSYIKEWGGKFVVAVPKLLTQ